MTKEEMSMLLNKNLKIYGYVGTNEQMANLLEKVVPKILNSLTQKKGKLKIQLGKDIDQSNVDNIEKIKMKEQLVSLLDDDSEIHVPIAEVSPSGNQS